MTEPTEESDIFMLPTSPLQAKINGGIKSIHTKASKSKSDDYRREVEDALYLAVKKRMKERVYEGDDKAYITGLLSDISEAKFEHQKISFDSDVTSATFRKLQAILMSLL